MFCDDALGRAGRRLTSIVWGAAARAGARDVASRQRRLWGRDWTWTDVVGDGNCGPRCVVAICGAAGACALERAHAVRAVVCDYAESKGATQDWLADHRTSGYHVGVLWWHYFALFVGARGAVVRERVRNNLEPGRAWAVPFLFTGDTPAIDAAEDAAVLEEGRTRGGPLYEGSSFWIGHVRCGKGSSPNHFIVLHPTSQLPGGGLPIRDRFNDALTRFASALSDGTRALCASSGLTGSLAADTRVSLPLHATPRSYVPRLPCSTLCHAGATDALAPPMCSTTGAPSAVGGST